MATIISHFTNKPYTRTARTYAFIHSCGTGTYLFVNCCLFLWVYWLLLLYFFFSWAHKNNAARVLFIDQWSHTYNKKVLLSVTIQETKCISFIFLARKKNHVDLSFAIYFGKSHDAHTFYIFLHWYIWNRSISVIQKCCIWSINTIFTSICKSFNGRLCLCGTL